MTNKFTMLVIAACLVTLTADRIYDRFFDRTPSRVYVMRGDMSVTVESGQLDSIGVVEQLPGDPLDVNVTGGTLDHKTDWEGNLVVRIAN